MLKINKLFLHSALILILALSLHGNLRHGPFYLSDANMSVNIYSVWWISCRCGSVLSKKVPGPGDREK